MAVVGIPLLFLSLCMGWLLPRAPARGGITYMGMSRKQAELAAMLDAARRERERRESGAAAVESDDEGERKETVAPAPAGRQAERVAPQKKKAVTADELFAAVKRVAATGKQPRAAAKPLSTAQSQKRRAVSAEPLGAPARGASLDEQYEAFESMVAGGRAGRGGRVISAEILKQGELLPVRRASALMQRHYAHSPKSEQDGWLTNAEFVVHRPMQTD